MRGLIIIPVVDEFDSIKCLIKELKSKEVLIINDSGKKINLKLYKNHALMSNDKNRGKGFSLRAGFKYAIFNKFDYVILMDADGEHQSNQLPIFENNILNHDIVFGYRDKYRSRNRKLLNKFMVFWLNLLGIKISDISCGYRAIRVEFLEKLCLNSDGFDIDIEIVLESIKKNGKYSIVKLDTIQNEKSHVGLFDYLLINNRFDKWIINNIIILKINKFLKLFLFISSVIGIILSFVIRQILVFKTISRKKAVA